jgi:uncharacterized protein (DUF3820 family)
MLTDDSILGFGKHKDKALKDVPNHWFTWISTQAWFIKSVTTADMQLKEYIVRRSKEDKRAIPLPQKTGWKAIFEEWQKSDCDDIQDWLEMYYEVPGRRE